MSEMGRGNPSRRQALEEMTKTAQELLDAARKNPHGVVSFSSGFVTSRKNGSYGHRKASAARKTCGARTSQVRRDAQERDALEPRLRRGPRFRAGLLAH